MTDGKQCYTLSSLTPKLLACQQLAPPVAIPPTLTQGESPEFHKGTDDEASSL